MRAIQRLCRNVHPQRLAPRQVTYCGVKDQRGVTLQKIQIPGHIYPESVARAAENAFGPAEAENLEEPRAEISPDDEKSTRYGKDT